MHDGNWVLVRPVFNGRTKQNGTVHPILKLRLLGSMGIDEPLGQVSLPRGRKTRAILAVLALASPRPVLRLTLTALLWSQRQNEQARASLRQSVHELQDALGVEWGHLLNAERHHIQLKGEGLVVDALSLAQPGSADLATLALFRSTLLEDLDGLDPAFDRWLTDERARLKRTVLAIGEGFLETELTLPGKVAAAEQLLEIDGGYEAAWRAIIRCHVDNGDRPAARVAYERCRSALIERGLSGPSRETTDLLARIEGVAPLPVAEPETQSLPLASIAVPVPRSGVRMGILPLRSMDPDRPGQPDGLALGLAEEITTSLARFRWISCVSGSSLSAIAGNGPDRLVPWDGMGVDFVLDGTLQRGGSLVRILVRIVDMRSGGEVIWARRFDREVADTLTLQDDLAAEIVAQIDPELLVREGERGAMRVSAGGTLSPQDLVLRAVPAIYRLDRGGFHAAGAILEEALVLDPSCSSAYAWYAYWHLFLVGQGWTDDPAASVRRGSFLAERAVTLDPGDARALTLAGHVRGYLGKRPREACALHDRAIALNSNLALAWCFSGLSLSYLGQHDDGLIRVRQASRMSPSDPHSFFFDMAMMVPYLLTGNHEKVVEYGRRSVELNPGFSSSVKLYLAALGHLGREQEAAEVRERLMRLEAGFSIAAALDRAPLMLQEDRSHYAEGLRRAGLPETGGMFPAGS